LVDRLAGSATPLVGLGNLRKTLEGACGDR
jgi:hypothetical protein